MLKVETSRKCRGFGRKFPNICQSSLRSMGISRMTVSLLRVRWLWLEGGQAFWHPSLSRQAVPPPAARHVPRTTRRPPLSLLLPPADTRLTTPASGGVKPTGGVIWLIQRLEEFQVIRLAHPPYSHQFSPCEFWFVGWSKDMIKGHQFQRADNVRAFLLDL
jgi:hypothetical protein